MKESMKTVMEHWGDSEPGEDSVDKIGTREAFGSLIPGRVGEYARYVKGSEARECEDGSSDVFASACYRAG